MALSCSSLTVLSRLQSLYFPSSSYAFTHQCSSRPTSKNESNSLLLLFVFPQKNARFYFQRALLLKATAICIAADSWCGTLKTEQRKRPNFGLVSSDLSTL
jgi:hypothetical protein